MWYKLCCAVQRCCGSFIRILSSKYARDQEINETKLEENYFMHRSKEKKLNNKEKPSHAGKTRKKPFA
jgi:hypothetical protein